jgi:hypothetical protein
MLVTHLIARESALSSGVPAMPHIDHRGDSGPFRLTLILLPAVAAIEGEAAGRTPPWIRPFESR